MKKRFLIGGVVIVFGMAAFLLLNHSGSKPNGRVVQVQISANGFSPSAIVVTPGTQIVWKNVDTAPHAVASNPYPSSSSLKDLHSQTILPGGSYSYVAMKSGVIDYHDDTQPTHNASIGVEK